jgi:hypothetical protein
MIYGENTEGSSLIWESQVMVVRRMFPVAVLHVVVILIVAFLTGAFRIGAGMSAADDRKPTGKTTGSGRPSGGEPLRDRASVEIERRQTAAYLVSQLGNPRFEIREEATRRLEQSGIEAVEPLMSAAGGESLEITCRAIRALGSIYESDDTATFDAAEAALEHLVESSNRSAAQRASAILSPQELFWTQESDERRLRRWKRAVLRIRALGGIVELVDDSDREITEIPPDEYVQVNVILEEGWKGGEAGLVNLKRMAVRPPLPVVYVTKGGPIPGEAIDNLQRELPHLRIETRGQAMLGVSCERGPPCRISIVKPNSAAERAGLKIRDVILKYDGEELTNFDRLIEITKGHKAGDKIAIEVLRDGETVIIEAELTGWARNKPVEAKK